MTATAPGLDTEFTRIIDELTRRGFLAGGASVTGLVLAGCSAVSSGSPHASPGFPVTVPGREGSATVTVTVTVTAPPGRVVAVGYRRDTDLALV